MGLDLTSVTLHPDYASRPNVYLGGYQDGILQSLNGGLTWNPLNEGLGNLNIRDLVTTLDEGSIILFSATEGGIWRYGGDLKAPEPEQNITLLPLVFRNGMLTQ